MKVKTLIGPQTIRSGLLGVLRFRIDPKKKKATTNQIPIEPIAVGWLLMISVLINTIYRKNHKIAIWMNGKKRMFLGRLPGNFPPLANFPKGAPKARAS